MPLASAINPIWAILEFSGDRTLLITDRFLLLQANTVGGTQTVTIPPHSDVAFNVGDQLSFEQKNTAVLDIADGAGVNIDSRGALFIANGRFAVFSIVQDEIDNWVLFGDWA